MPRTACLFLTSVLPLTFFSIVHAADPIPYPAALARATVSEDDIADISKRGLVVGNGELNAVVYSEGNNLRLRIAKNDCWDLRIDTKNDPPLPSIDPATGKVSGHGPAGSWKTPYPTALPCAELVLGPAPDAPVTNATLDLGRAEATIKTAQDTTEIRVLAQSNVILIRSARPASFVGILDFLKDKNIDQWISKADLGTQAECSYIHQNIPGDEDVSGMDIDAVTGNKDGLRAVAVVTSRDSPHPLEDATALVKETLQDAGAVAQHERIWQDFWAKSGVQLGDEELQNWWYRMLYFNRVFARSGGNAIGLAACFDHLAGWHNSLKLNYNIQQTYLAATALNHPELLEPFIDVLNRNLPRARWFAGTSFVGAEGAFFHSDFYPFEPDPAKCVTKYRHQQSYVPYGYTWGMNGHTAVVIWDYYLFAPSARHLDRVYPLLKDFGTFYCSMLENCALVDGKRRMGPSYFPELGGYHEYDVCYDIHFVTAGLQIAREAAELKHDADFLKRIDAVIGQVPAYGTQPDPDQGGQTVIEQWSGAKFQEGADRHGTMIQGIFPAGIINWFSSADLKELGQRTINRVEKSTSHANSNVMLNIARARLGLGDEAIANAKMCFSGATGKFSREQPNGLFFWNAHGYYMSEQVAVARLVTELLLQSVGGVIRIFPAWPATTDARFAGLLAQGGFEVSAEQTGGKVGNVVIRSTVGEIVKLLSPWPGAVTVTEQGTNIAVPVSVAADAVSFATRPGKSYSIKSNN